MLPDRSLLIGQKLVKNAKIQKFKCDILSGQKFTKNAKNGPFWRVFLKPEACGQTVLPDRSILIGQKLAENAKIKNFKWDILIYFQTLCPFLVSDETANFLTYASLVFCQQKCGLNKNVDVASEV